MKHLFNHSELEDKVLIADALSGSKTALEHLLSRHYNFIYNVALRFVLSPQDAQDLTQEVVIKVITKLAQFNEKAEFRTWLYRIVFHHFLNTKRRAMENAIVSFEEYGHALDDIPLTDLNGEEQKEYAEMIIEAKLGCMTGMLICLERKQRLVYILGDIFEIHSQTASELLEISAANFRKILSRARKDMYHFMNNKCGLINTNNPCRCSKKTKGFIKVGWVNPDKLVFNSDFLEKVSEIAAQKVNACDTLIEEEYAALYKDSPYYDRDQSKALANELVNDTKFRKLFDLE